MSLNHPQKNRTKVFGFLLLAWVLVQSIVLVCHTLKPLPLGISFAGQEHAVEEIRFLKDLTFTDVHGQRHSEQEVFDAVSEMIDRAKTFVLIDMFLFNPYLGKTDTPLRDLCDELTERLVEKKASSPETEIVFISDPINTRYGGLAPRHLVRLEEAGIRIVYTAIEKLRDSNPLYSSFWRMTGRWLGNSPGDWAPNPFGEGRVSLRSYLHLLNFKANHRKVVIADDDRGLIGLVTTANPHDGSSAHENVAIQFRGAAVGDLLKAERAVLTMSGADPIRFEGPPISPSLFLGGSELTLQVVSERKIKEAVIDALNTTGIGDSIRLVMFYLSDRDIVDAFRRAHQRGASVQVMLDPNRDAFGMEKNGVPNRQVAYELHREKMEVRWRQTNGEQCHTKLLYIEYQDQGAFLSTGSANYTRRNLDDFNLEMNVIVRGESEHPVFGDVRAYFEQLWGNTEDREFTVDYEDYADPSLLKRTLYRAMEASGMCTF